MDIKYRISEDPYAGWYWIMFGPDGYLVAESGQCYTRRSDAYRALKRLIKRMSQPHTLTMVKW